MEDMEEVFQNISDIKLKLKECAVIDIIKSPKVSVIVPAYNNSAFLAKCLFPLVQQTLKEIEIIVVDDGSTDNTASILSVFAEADSRVKVITQKHAMQGAARNKGTNAATGEYIGFIDSDDWVDLDYYEKLYNAAKKYNSDIALATNVRIGNGKTKLRLNIKEEKFVTSLQDKIDIGNQAKNPCPTNKIYKSSLLKDNNIQWEEGVYCEDKLFTIQAVYYANGIVAVPGIYYYYFRNPHSTVNTKAKRHLKKLIEDKNNAKKKVLSFLKLKNADIRDREFWAIKKQYGKICTIKESLNTEKIYIFGIPIFSISSLDYKRNTFEILGMKFKYKCKDWLRL